MSSSRRALLAAFLVLPVAGCGFQPLYGSAAPARRLVGRIALGDITRSALPDRMVFALRDALKREIGSPEDPAFRLDIAVEVEEEGFAITQDNETTRFSLTGMAEWDLRRVAAARPVLSGLARSFTAYSATASVYATRIAARDAETRLATGLAQQIVVQIAARAAALEPSEVG
ncbi:MAG: LPS assembly lipoprotein LptE [Pseudomonadota bacterium]